MDPNSSHYQQQAPPPYPYQQPLQGQHSNEYAPYPQVNQQQEQQQQPQQGSPGLGTPVMGAPANPSAHPDNKFAAAGGYSSPSDPSSMARQGSGQVHDQTSASQTQSPPSNSGQTPQSPYVQQSNPNTGKGTMDQIVAQVTVYGKKAEDVVNKVWSHLTSGQSVADTAWGRMNAGTQLLTKGGFEGVFKATFPADANETLKKTYACFLSTSTGPVGGTLYISSKKLAFCSDRPLSYTPSPGQQAFSYYKVILPLDRVRDVAPSVNQLKPAEKYIQVTTQDGFEFWFMGFVNYDKGVKNLQEAVATRGAPGQSPTAGSPQQQYPPNQPNSQQPYPPNQYGTTRTG